MPGRTWEARRPYYRYGFNGQENDNEISGKWNHTTAEFWEYDPRAGRRWNLDPRPTVGISQYSAFNNNPILFSDPHGDTIVVNLFDKKHDGPVYHNVANTAVSNQKNDGVFLVYSHSHSGGIQYTDKDVKVQLAQSAEEFNKIMSERSPEYKQALKDGKQIVLKSFSCNTASEEYVTHDGQGRKREFTIAGKIADGLPDGSIVVAADGYVWYGMRNGKPAVLGVQQTNANEPENTNNGGFVTIKKNQKTHCKTEDVVQ